MHRVDIYYVRVIATQKLERNNSLCIKKGYSGIVSPQESFCECVNKTDKVEGQTGRKRNVTVNSLECREFRTATEKSPLHEIM